MLFKSLILTPVKSYSACYLFHMGPGGDKVPHYFICDELTVWDTTTQYRRPEASLFNNKIKHCEKTMCVMDQGVAQNSGPYT